MKRTALAAIAACLAIVGCGSHHNATPPTLPTPAQAAHSPVTRVPSQHLAQAGIHGNAAKNRTQFRLDATVLPPGLTAPRPLTGTSTLAGEDAVTITNIPLGEPVVGCYDAGTFANCTAARARFPHSHIVTISPSALIAADVLDVEPGDATPSQAPTFYNVAKAAHIARPGFYASLGNGIIPTRSDLEAAGHARSSFLLWVAEWDNNCSIPAGFDAKQCASNAFVDHDIFGSWFFTKPKLPNAPGCSTPSIKTSYCWGRFTTLDWFNRPSGSKTAKIKPWCYYGCVERSLVKRLTGEIFASQTPAGLKGDLARAKAVCGRLIYLEQHRSVKENGDTYTYGRKPNVCGRSKDIARGSWYRYL